MAVEMGKTAAAPSSRKLAIVADPNLSRQPPGCGVFFLLLDWNRRLSRNKLSSPRLLSHQKLKIADENRGGFPSGEEMTCSPNLVARLMGLDSVPATKTVKNRRSDLSMEVFPLLKNLRELGGFSLSSSGMDPSVSLSRWNDPYHFTSGDNPRSYFELIDKRRSMENASVSGSNGDLSPKERIQRKKTEPDFLSVLLDRKIKELSNLGKDETVAGVLEELISALTCTPFSEPKVTDKNDPSSKISFPEEESGEILGKAVIDDALEILVDFFPKVQSDREELKLRRFLFDCIAEHVDLNYSQWARVEMPLPASKQLAHKVNRDVETWGRMARKGLDEIVRWDLNRTAENWVDPDSEAFLVGVDIGTLIIELLVNEVAHDLVFCSVNSRFRKGRADSLSWYTRSQLRDVSRSSSDLLSDFPPRCG